MKKQIYTSAMLIMLALASTQVKAQSKIKDGSVAGTSSLPGANAILELESNKRGLLLPRVTLSATNNASPLSAHIAGMTVYNTATAGTGATAVIPAYYYNDGTKWIKLSIKGDVSLNNTALSSSTSPAGVTIGDMIFNTNASSGVPVGPTYWDGTNWVPVAGAASVEPWNNVATGTGATANTQNIYQMGQVLVNTSTVPTGGSSAKLIVNNGTTNGAIQIKDGSEGNGKYLVSDVNGVGTWKSGLNAASTVDGTVILSPSTTTSTLTSGIPALLGSITLGKGTWLVKCSRMTRNPNLTVADNATYIMLDYPITSGTMFSNAANAITASYGYLPVAGGAANYYNQSIVYTVASGTKTLYFYGVPQFNSSWDYTYTLGTLNSMRAYLFYE